MILPIACLFVDIALTFVFLGYFSGYTDWYGFETSAPGSVFLLMSRVQKASWILSFVTNAIATLMIAYQLWSVHPSRNIKKSHVF
jgi:hypothetical protein